MKAEKLLPYIPLALGLALLAMPLGQPPSPERPAVQKPPTPPGPPVVETFEGTPQLALFPRLGDFRPEDGDERLPYWRTYREHLLKISGVINPSQGGGNHAFSFRGIKGINSVGHFIPLAVQPNRTYRLSLRLNATASEQATAGVGLLEFKKFIWLGEQYPESLHQQLFLAARELVQVAATDGWQSFERSFTTGPETRMIHLVLFREGPVSDRSRVLVDDIRIESVD